MAKRSADSNATDKPEAKARRVEGNDMTNLPASNGEADGQIDEQLHSRQLAVYGRDTMRRLAGANVFISGMKGLGLEIGALNVSQLLLLLFFCCQLTQLHASLHLRRSQERDPDRCAQSCRARPGAGGTGRFERSLLPFRK